jgi:hypothetical protein
MEDYTYSTAYFKVPDQPTDPPEPSDAARDERNWFREEAMIHIDYVVENLDALEHDGQHRHTQIYLERLREYLENDMED